MKKFLTALQLYSVRDDLENSFYDTLKKVKEFGYDGVEFAGLYNHSADEIKKMCEELQLIPISAHVPFDQLMSDLSLIEVYAQIGCKYIAIPYLTEEYRPGHEKFMEFVKGAKLISKKAKEFNIQLCYHNHDFEFEKVNGEYGLDLIYKAISPELLSTELDTCWVNVGGENPAEYIRKYNQRIEIVHLKDFAGSKSDNMYALIGIDDKDNKKSSGEFEFRPVGYGLQDFKSIIKACDEVQASWLIVEQDNPSMKKSALECAKMSIDYLKTIL